MYGERPPPVEPTAFGTLSDVLEALDSRAAAWRRLPRCEKAALFKECISSVCKHGEAIAEVSTRAKGTYGSGIGEEYVSSSGTHTVRGSHSRSPLARSQVYGVNPDCHVSP